MCGICGQFNYRDGAPVEAESIRRMNRTIVHRGPDDEGYYLSGALGLGFRRLAILDLSPAGHQPMSDQSKRVWVVFNGEIYNFRELRAELEALGHVFRSQCDTEVIVEGYKQWGESVLNRFNGMFGLAIWDEDQRRLLVARDPMGIKPVYYALREGCLYFGSELRPVLAGLEQRPPVDPVALNLFLRYRYTPAPLTLYQGIRKLAPGELLSVQKGEVTTHRWYQFSPDTNSLKLSDAEAQERLLEIYKQSMKRHLISDVPVGLLLSGGIDSGLLLGLMRLYGQDWPTFTVGYGASFQDDELTDAEETARIFNAGNVAVKLDARAFEKALPRIVAALEEPVASSSIVPMYFVCQRAREEVKVALIGQGPDELFGGYTRHLGVCYGTYWRKLPGFVRGPLVSVVQSLPRQESLKRAAYSLGVEQKLQRFQQIFSIQPGAVVDGLFRDGALPAGAGDKVLECWADLAPSIDRLDDLSGFQLLELRSALPDELLMYADKLSMAHALETRVPYLDRELVEFVQCLPARFKIRKGTRKWLHRQVCREFLAPSILRRKKRGFAVNVVDDWFQKSLSGKLEKDLLDPQSRMYNYLRPQVVSSLLREHSQGTQDNHKLLFSLVVFEEWLRLTQA